jgi:hypothetical protein
VAKLGEIKKLYLKSTKNNNERSRQMAEKQAIKPSERAGGFTHKAGSTLYQVNVYFDTAGREPLEDKILRLIKIDFEFGADRTNFRNRENAKNTGNDLQNPESRGTMDLLQMGRLPERGAT